MQNAHVGHMRIAAQLNEHDVPRSYRVFCERETSHPACIREGAFVMQATPERLNELAAINRAVNGDIRYRAEPPGRDDWLVNPKQGDCEDFALAKMKKLVEAGWPSNALRLAFGYTGRTRDFHVNLIAVTDRGDFVLDNRWNEPRDWRSVDMLWTLRQSKSGGWEIVDNPK